MVARSRYQLVGQLPICCTNNHQVVTVGYLSLQMRTSLLHKYARISARKKLPVGRVRGAMASQHSPFRSPSVRPKLKLRSKNRVWVAGGAPVLASPKRVSPQKTRVSAERRMTKTRNLLWVPGRRKSGETGRGGGDSGKKRGAHFVSLRQGGRFVVDSSGKRMKRLSLCSGRVLKKRSISVSNPGRGMSVNRLLAR